MHFFVCFNIFWIKGLQTKHIINPVVKFVEITFGRILGAPRSNFLSLEQFNVMNTH